MIKNITVTNHLNESVVINMRSPEQSGFFIRGITGLGPPQATINRTEVLSIDGSFFNSARVSDRNIVFYLGFYNDGTLTIEQIRKKSYKYFPIKKRIEIIIETDTRIAKTYGYVETNEPNIFSKEESTSISVVCPDSYFVGTSTIQTLFSGHIPLFEFPFENPSLTEPLIELGNILLETQQTVYYEGDAETGIKITIYFLGEVNHLTIYNVSRHQTMSIDSDKLIALTGSDFAQGDILTISTIKGNKYVRLLRDGETINILNTLILSEWFTLENGDNLFLFEALSGSSNIQFSVEHNPLYEGM